jgi:hypothetical protein
VLLAIRKTHSLTDHPELREPLAGADISLHCQVCGEEIDRLAVTTTTLGSEIMARRSDHERMAHRSG